MGKVDTSAPLKTLLGKCRLPSGSKIPMTHLGLSGYWKGKYAIPPEHRDTFLDTYTQAVQGGDRPTLAEVHDEIGPVVVDIDLRYSLDDRYERRYTLEQVRRVVRFYRDALAKFVSVPEDKNLVYVFEKSNPVRSSGYLKDGIHIMFPWIRTTPWVQYAVRDAVLEAYAKDPVFPDVANPAEDVFDAAVIKRNAWMLVGSSKSIESQAYVLRHVWDSNGETRSVPPIHEQIRTCVIRGAQTETVTYCDGVDPDALRVRYSGNRAVPENTEEYEDPALQLCQTNCDIEYTKQLVSILDPSRFDDYASWIDVGMCLFNISEDLLPTWDKCSQLSSKYVPGDCEVKWRTFSKKGLGIGTLCMWAKQDNPDLYAEIRDASEIGFIERALSLTNRDVARLVHFQFRRDFVCVSEKHKTWFHYEQHRWVKTPGGYQMRTHVMDTLSERIFKIRNDIRKRIEAMAEGDNEVKNLQDQLDKYNKLDQRIGSKNFVDDVISVCSTRFLDPFFREKQDARPELLGFTNGVLDLDAMEFRDGEPDDCVTLSTNHSFRWWDEYVAQNDPRCEEIHRFLSDILPEKDIRDYVMTVLASAIYGTNLEQKVHIWTGGGGNGKSKLIELFESALGDYTGRLPTSVLTQRRGSSSAANPELARMVGRRFASLHEPETGDKIHVGVMKELSGGDRILARNLYEEPFEFVPCFKMVLLCNRLPVIPSSDRGVWRRLRVVEFNTKFVEYPPREPNERRIDPGLNAKIATWSEPFMALLVEYFRKYWKRVKETGGSIHEPDAVTHHTREYQKRSDMVWNYLDERFEFTGLEIHTLPVSEIFYQFRTWFSENYSGAPMSQNDFKIELQKHNLDSSQGIVRGVRFKRVEASGAIGSGDF